MFEMMKIEMTARPTTIARATDVEYVLDLDELADDRFIRADICYALDHFDVRNGLLGLRRVLEGQDVAVAQRVVRGIVVLEDARVLAQLLAVFFERDIAVLELHGRDIADLLKLRLKVLSLARREIFVDPDDDLVGLLQVNDAQVDVVRDERHRAGQDQTGDHDGDRRDRHEPVLEDVAQAFLPIVTKTSHA